MIKTILAATDGSNHARRAVALAAELAVKYRARLIVLHVLLDTADSDRLRKLATRRLMTREQRALLDRYHVDMQRAYVRAGMVGIETAPAPTELLVAIGRQILDKAKTAANKAGVTRIATALSSWNPADTILAYAEGEEAGLIVVGARGLSEIGGLLQGSVSHKVASRAPCPVVTVR